MKKTNLGLGRVNHMYGMDWSKCHSNLTIWKQNWYTSRNVEIFSLCASWAFMQLCRKSYLSPNNQPLQKTRRADKNKQRLYKHSRSKLPPNFLSELLGFDLSMSTLAISVSVVINSRMGLIDPALSRIHFPRPRFILHSPIFCSAGWLSVVISRGSNGHIPHALHNLQPLAASFNLKDTC